MAASASFSLAWLVSTAPLGGGGVVARGLDVDDGLVDALLLRLDVPAEVLQLLVGGRDGGNEARDPLWADGCGDRDSDAVGEDGRDEDTTRERTRNRGAKGASHWTPVSRSTPNAAARSSGPEVTEVTQVTTATAGAFCTVRHI